MKIKLNSNIISGAMFLVIGIVMNFLIPSQIRTFETGSVNAQTVPTLLIRGLILLSAILLVQGILSKDKKSYDISAKLFQRESLKKLKPLIYIVMLMVYAVLLPLAGFIISSLLLSNGILLYFRARKWWFYAIASGNVFLAFFAFQAMRITLP